jgi:cytochrome c oxidase subunit 1
MLVFLANLVYSVVMARVPAAENPWQSRSLEWQLPTPVPAFDFTEIPVVQAGPYDYVSGALPMLVPREAAATGE